MIEKKLHKLGMHLAQTGRIKETELIANALSKLAGHYDDKITPRPTPPKWADKQAWWAGWMAALSAQRPFEEGEFQPDDVARLDWSKHQDTSMEHGYSDGESEFPYDERPDKLNPDRELPIDIVGDAPEEEADTKSDAEAVNAYFALLRESVSDRSAKTGNKVRAAWKKLPSMWRREHMAYSPFPLEDPLESQMFDEDAHKLSDMTEDKFWAGWEKEEADWDEKNKVH